MGQCPPATRSNSTSTSKDAAEGAAPHLGGPPGCSAAQLLAVLTVSCFPSKQNSLKKTPKKAPEAAPRCRPSPAGLRQHPTFVSSVPLMTHLLRTSLVPPAPESLHRVLGEPNRLNSPKQPQRSGPEPTPKRGGEGRGAVAPLLAALHPADANQAPERRETPQAHVLSKKKILQTKRAARGNPGAPGTAPHSSPRAPGSFRARRQPPRSRGLGEAKGSSNCSRTPPARPENFLLHLPAAGPTPGGCSSMWHCLIG